jgi:hypothetical protein
LTSPHFISTFYPHNRINTKTKRIVFPLFLSIFMVIELK